MAAALGHLLQLPLCPWCAYTSDSSPCLHACCLQNPATQVQAEQVLLQFRRSPGSLPACRHILEASGSAEARFHAACTLREALLREWATHTPEERASLRTYLLQYVLHHAAEPQLAVVRSILQGTLAVMLKRSWVDTAPEARAAFFQVGRLAGQLSSSCGISCTNSS